MKKSLLLLLFATQALAGPPVLWGPDNKILGLEAGLYLPQSGTPTGSPLSGYDYIYTKSDDNLYIKNSSGVETQVGGSSSAVTTMGAFGSTPNNNGGSIATSTLTLQPADATHPGGVSTTTQAFGGVKNFASRVNANGTTQSTAALGVRSVSDTVTNGVAFESADGTHTHHFTQRNNGDFFWWDNNNSIVNMEITGGGSMAFGNSAPTAHFEVNNADNNTTPATTTQVAGVNIRNTGTTAGNYSNVTFMNGGQFITSAVIGVHDDPSAGTGAGSVHLVVSTAATRKDAFQVDQFGHTLTSQTTAPAVTVCGTSPTIAANSTDTSGTITVGTGGVATSCLLTFKKAWVATPKCFVNDQTAILAVQVIPSTTTATFNAALAFAASTVLDYYCTGNY